MANLTPKQQRFVDEYLIDLNATQAAIRAGYSEKSADKIGSELLGKTRVSEAIQEAQNKRSERTEITQDYVLSNIKKVVERCMQVEAIDGETTTENGEIAQAFVFKEQGALKGLEMLGKHLGMFKDKVEHSGGVTVTSIADLMDNIGDNDL
ncbi:terminase small subunit [Acinetobacter sp. B10A]|uniref:terminase small subunit n=1 Tax=Acinetobacter baretiae TaxID=2605383 RepID=UPI001B3C8CBE|nr:terminase small subunit [Acinetobacter baretiae]MBF7685938.1 terminase small subunit [Acinetobacter baretiae]